MNDITITAGFDRNKILESGNSVRYLVVDIDAPSKPTTKTLPINLALVIDASISMEGPWLDAAKDAAIGVIRTLRDEDMISVISFSSLKGSPGAMRTMKNVRVAMTQRTGMKMISRLKIYRDIARGYSRWIYL